jgi:alpha-tubulin suppressor-like RCC1 family protein
MKNRWIALFVVIIGVSALSRAVEVVTTNFPDGTEMTPYTYGLDATNGVAPYTWSVSSSVIAWGDNQIGQSTIAPDLTDVVGLAAGEWHSLALKANGTVVAWGNSGDGQTSVPAGLSAVVAIAGGRRHNLALRINGTVVAWGENAYGKTVVPAGLTNAIAVSGGEQHSLVLKSDGTVLAWGDNSLGQTNVPAGLSNVVKIAAGAHVNFALKSDGTVVAWGYVDSGQTNFPAGLSNAVAIAAGLSHCLALTSNGCVIAWGGSGPKIEVPDGLSNVVAVAAGGNHSIALKDDGTIIVFGININNQLNIPAGLTNMVTIAAGGFHSLALRAKSTVLPEGLVCSSSGLVSGTPVLAGTNRVAVAVSDALGATFTKPLEIVILPHANNRPVISSNTPPVAVTDIMEGGHSQVFQIWANDPEGSNLTYSWTWDGAAVGGNTSAYTRTTSWGGLGLHLLRCTVSDGFWSNHVSAAWAVTVQDVPLEILTTALPVGREMVPYSHNLEVTNGVAPYTWSVSSSVLPEGLVCSSSGIVSGAPALAGTNWVTFAVSDAQGATLTKPLEIVILTNANTRPVISSNSPPVAAIDMTEAGHSQAFQVWANDPEGSNLTYSWTWDGGAVGSNVSAYAHTTRWGGLGIHLLRCTVSDGLWSNYVSAAWAVTVQDIPLEIRTASFPAGQEAVPYSQSLDVTNGVAPYIWSLGATELPAGLSCSTNGVVSGTPYLAITSAVTFIVQDSEGAITNKTLEIAIAPNSNLRPVVTSIDPSSSSFSLTEGGGSRLLQIWANDPEGSNLTYSWTWDGQPVGANASTYTRTTSWEGPGLHALRCYVSDGLWSNIVFAHWAVTVVDVPIKIMTSSLTGCPPLVACSTVLQATNGVVPYIWSIKAPVVGWGFNGFGAIDVPDELSSVVALACGGYHSLALQSDGRVVAWGYNEYGQADVPSGLSSVAAIAAGDFFNMALQSNGSVVVWGEILDGQTNFPPDLSNAVAIAAGGYHCLARQGNGRVVAWGYNGEGETDVPSNLTEVAAIAAGLYHSLALQSNGTVVAWGDNWGGQANVPPSLSNVVALAGGGSHSLALQADGRVVAWGDNSYGQTNVPPGLSNVVALAGGGSHSLALQSNGTVVVWGDDGDGQLSLPTDLAPARLITAGGRHSLALRSRSRDLPAGLTCSSSGILSGTPEHAGIYTMTVMVQDQLGAQTNKTLILVVGPDRATNNVPTWWLAQYGLTNFNDDAVRDLDGDGLLNWQEWLAGSDPSDILSVFGMTGASLAAGQNIVLRWPSISDRVYDVSWTTNLLAGQNAFALLAGATNLPATPPENICTTAVQNAGPWFYRIGVRE